MFTYNLEKLRVLVIDDSQYMVKIIKTLLDAMGIEAVRGIDCPSNIFSELKNWQPDLVITDYIMEPINGLQLIHRIRNQVSDPKRFIPIILLTGYAHEHVVTDARFHAGADAVLVKPVSVQRLYSCIVSVYESQRTFVQTATYFGPDRRVKDRPFEGPDRRKSNASPDPTVTEDHDGLELVLVDRDDRKEAEDAVPEGARTAQGAQ